MKFAKIILFLSLISSCGLLYEKDHIRPTEYTKARHRIESSQTSSANTLQDLD